MQRHGLELKPLPWLRSLSDRVRKFGDAALEVIPTPCTASRRVGDLEHVHAAEDDGDTVETGFCQRVEPIPRICHLTDEVHEAIAQ
jgi:hypothetical protein